MPSYVHMYVLYVCAGDSTHRNTLWHSLLALQRVKTPPTSVLDIILKNLMVTL